MNRKTFKPEDFSPIHHYPEVPDKEGWYVSTWNTLEKLHEGKLLVIEGRGSSEFWYWTEKGWAINDNRVLSAQQNRNWFGLKENPNVLL